MKMNLHFFRTIGDEPWLDGYTPPFHIQTEPDQMCSFADTKQLIKQT